MTTDPARRTARPPRGSGSRSLGSPASCGRAAPVVCRPSQWSALVSVEEHESLRIGDLAEREGVSAPTATRLVASLEEAGLLSRTSDPADRRTAYVALTDAGREKLEWARACAPRRWRSGCPTMPEATSGGSSSCCRCWSRSSPASDLDSAPRLATCERDLLHPGAAVLERLLGRRADDAAQRVDVADPVRPTPRRRLRAVRLRHRVHRRGKRLASRSSADAARRERSAVPRSPGRSKPSASLSSGVTSYWWLSVDSVSSRARMTAGSVWNSACLMRFG